MMIPLPGDYRYTIRRGEETIAIEEEKLEPRRLSGLRRSADGVARYEAEADLDRSGMVRRVSVRYRRGPFARDAAYEVGEDFMRGSVSAMAGRTVVAVKLGRFREVDADLMLFRALTLAHVRERGQERWTGKVAVIDPATLVAASVKQSCRQRGVDPSRWLYEPRMSDWEEIDLDADGRITHRHDSRGFSASLDSFAAAR